MEPVSYHSPRIMEIGGGAVARVAAVLARLGLARPLIVTDPFMVSSGLLDRLTGPLAAAGISFDVFSDTIPEPTDIVVEEGVRRINPDHDCLLALGGGSPIDTAKAMTILAAGGGKMRDYKVPMMADAAKLPLIAVPTTAGTGSEATRFTVITDAERHEKMLIAGLGALPLAAIVDYELTLSVPARITADTGVDSFTHALEAYVSRRANAVSDGLAVSAMGLIGPNLRLVFHEPQNKTARAAMMLGATQAGLAFSNASVALVHGMSRPIGAHFHVPHGMSNAMLLPCVTRFSLSSALPRYAQAARLAGFAEPGDADQVAGAKLLAGLESLNRELNVPSPATFGIDERAWHEALPVMAAQALASGSPAQNPRAPTEGEIIALYEGMYA
ncbi:MAG: iron-containing alcohol dehydrogenase [Acidocella sp.]|nr:iron-containing alcohol dehydrogenase [Acidocella sp.]